MVGLEKKQFIDPVSQWVILSPPILVIYYLKAVNLVYKKGNLGVFSSSIIVYSNSAFRLTNASDVKAVTATFSPCCNYLASVSPSRVDCPRLRGILNT